MQIVEIFKSLQGEGFQVGVPSIFIRTFGCNLNCKWCDEKDSYYNYMSINQIIAKVEKLSNKHNCLNVTITGGEPTIQEDFEELVNALYARGYTLFLETNGTNRINSVTSAMFTYVTVSPKFSVWGLYDRDREQFCLGEDDAHELRIVMDKNVKESDELKFKGFCQQMSHKWITNFRYLSPCYSKGKFNVLQAMKMIYELNTDPEGDMVYQDWMLSLQAHKLAGIK